MPQVPEYVFSGASKNSTMEEIREISVIISDDEVDARKSLRILLSNFSFINIVGEAKDLNETFELIAGHKPDIIFLDIQFQAQNAFDLIRRLQGVNADCTIVLVTAHKVFLHEAIKNAVFDYLLKPVDPHELGDTLERFAKIRAKKKEVREAEPYKNKIRFGTRSGAIFINPEEIVYCKAEGNYTRLVLNEHQSELVSFNIGHLEEMLRQPYLYRINRSYLINLNYLSRVDKNARLICFHKNHDVLTLKVNPKDLSLLRL
ncbi:MAG: response regulator transcription factor [Cyclobacteriaceae bacterium]|nr:response regulator transcription factor [Cyclobacteriaceae bacterium]